MKTTTAEVTSVQIYRNGAEIIRSGKAELDQGTNSLQIQGITSKTDTNTVRLWFPKGISLSDMRFETPSDEEDTVSDILREELTALQKQKEIREMQISLWSSSESFTARKEGTLQDIEAYIDKLPERLTSLYKECAELDKAIKKKEKELRKASSEETAPVIRVQVTAEKAGIYNFEVHGHEHGPFWKPVYEVHTDAENPLVLKMRAAIFQRTGKEWKDVQVSLLSGTPETGSLPKIEPCYLSIRQSIPTPRASNSMLMGKMMMAAAPGMAMDERWDEEPVEETVELDMVETEAASVSTGETMTEYVLPGPKTIPSDTAGTMADLQEFTINTEYEIIAVPKQDIRAYLTASIKSEDIPAMVKGSASVYLNGTYAGKANIDPALTEDTFVIPLGKAESIQLSRTEKALKKSSALLKNQQSEESSYELKITNGRDTRVSVTVTDQLPVSQDKTIIVEPLQISGAKKDEETGLLKWNLDLEPKETKTLLISYRVSWPKDKQIDRRSTPGGKFCPSCGAEVTGRKFCPVCGTTVA